MANLLLKINEKFNNLSVEDFFNYYHLGKEKSKGVKIYINDKLANKKTVLKLDDFLKLEYDDSIDFLPLDSKLDILYEDEYLLVVNKAAGILVHPDSKDKNGTLVNMVSNYYHKTNQNISVKYLHRIDVDTSGIVVFGKDILTTSYLMHQISQHTFVRRYLCLCSGEFKENEGRYDYPIAENRYIANKKRVAPTGKSAVTNYKVIERLRKNLNLCLVQLETGRTHQIRVHFSYKGHPLVGDSLYNGNTNLLKRQALHSYEVDFIHPITEKRIHIKCELPKDILNVYKMHKK
jgi:23S rRNA pseudouridine1911/1915/1917 synthase